MCGRRVRARAPALSLALALATALALALAGGARGATLVREPPARGDGRAGEDAGVTAGLVRQEDEDEDDGSRTRNIAYGAAGGAGAVALVFVASMCCVYSRRGEEGAGKSGAGARKGAAGAGTGGTGMERLVAQREGEVSGKDSAIGTAQAGQGNIAVTGCDAMAAAATMTAALVSEDRGADGDALAGGAKDDGVPASGVGASGDGQFLDATLPPVVGVGFDPARSSRTSLVSPMTESFLDRTNPPEADYPSMYESAVERGGAGEGGQPQPGGSAPVLSQRSERNIYGSIVDEL